MSQPVSRKKGNITIPENSFRLPDIKENPFQKTFSIWRKYYFKIVKKVGIHSNKKFMSFLGKIFQKVRKEYNFYIKPVPELKIERFVPLKKEFLGKTLHIHDIASFYLGRRELFDQDIYRFTSKKKDPYILDCGANLGMSVIYFKNLYPSAKITAFEADEYIFGFLKKNMKSFDYENVKIINKAVWDREETLSFFEEGGAGGRIEEPQGLKKYKEVKGTSLRTFLENIKVDFLKIDIEGAEFRVIKDCEDLLGNVEYLFIEYHSFPNVEQKLHEILNIVQRAGFKYHIKEAYTEKKPFLQRTLNVGMDLQLNIFCFKK